MCFPPFCHPAQHVLGCFGLRQGAAGVLVMNGFYGLCLVIVHSLLIGSERPITLDERSARRLGEGDGNWMIQLMDLDIGWGHDLLGFDDQTSQFAGLANGIVIILVCGYMFYNVQAGGLQLPTTTRWFVAFMNLELMLYVGIVLLKLPKLCLMQEQWMPDLHMECPVQKFTYIQRVICITIAASLCIWVFSSFAFSLTFGNVAMDRPEFAMDLENRDAYVTGKSNGLSGMGPSMSSASPYQTRQSLAPPLSLSGRQGISGGSVHAPLSSSASMRASPTSTQAGPQRTSYSIGNIARASSSMVSSTTDRSSNEMQSLIRPPLHVF